MSSSNLRDALLSSLNKLPGTREFHIHVLVSAPRKNNTLYPFASPRPRVYLQDILILLAEQTTPDSPQLLATAIEAHVYNIPSTSSAILYISKVDSTGQATAPSPTPTLVKSLLTYYADPVTRPVVADNLWIQLFARAQGQYLFPNSSDFEGKKPLSDIRLCGWWKRVFSDVASRTLDHTTASEKPKVACYYVLPGLGELEAMQAMKLPFATNDAGPKWTYGHPYSQKEFPLPCPPDASEGKPNLGHFIPWFDDDPKARFVDEIAYTTDTDVKSPVRKRSRTNSRGDKSQLQEGSTGDGKSGKAEETPGELRKVSADEFWERMSFRQECVAGAVTGFFTVIISSPPNENQTTSAQSQPSPLAPQPGQVASKINKRVLTTLMTGVEFSTQERSVRATEIVEGVIKGLCDGMPAVPTAQTRPHKAGSMASLQGSDRRTPEREVAPATLLVPPSTPPPRFAGGRPILPEVSPNPFPEPVTSLETYSQHIYGSVCVSNPMPEPRLSGNGAGDNTKDGLNGLASGSHVTVLTVRKKKKKAE